MQNSAELRLGRALVRKGAGFAALALISVLGGLSGCGLFQKSGNGNGSGGSGGGNGGGTGTPHPPDFGTTVVLGDSLSAGFQNGSLLDTQQPNGWASLVAKQVNFQLALPLIAPPGAPAVLQLKSVGPPPVVVQTSGVTTGRDDGSVQPYDLAVPGHILNNLIHSAPTAIPTSSEDIITDLVLGYPLGNSKSQLDEAIALKPTTIFLWIGNNDALLADTSGSPASMTDASTFSQEFQQLISTLQSQTTAKLIVANVPDVTQVPYLTPAANVIAQAATETGQTAAQIGPELGLADGDLVNATGMSQVESDVDAIKKGNATTPLTDSGFLSAAEVSQVQSTVNQYNTAIAQAVQGAGGVLVDMHAYIGGLAQNGATINNYHATTGFLGGLFSLDGMHPTNTGYALLANQYLTAMNTAYGTNYAQVDVNAVAAADPLFGSNIKPTGSVAITPEAGRAVDAVIGGRK